MNVLLVMDDFSGLSVKKDSTLALCEAMQKQGWHLFYTQINALSIVDGSPVAKAQSLQINWQKTPVYTLSESSQKDLESFDVIFMRKDPPFDMDYIFATYVLEQAAKTKTLVVNHPRALRDANEKLFVHWFPDCMPSTLVSAQSAQILTFVERHQSAVIKPLHGMGGQGVFRLQADDQNKSVIIETVTGNGAHLAMVQQYIPEIVDGDVRVLVMAGEVIRHVMARVPARDDFRGNLASGASAHTRPISDAEYQLASRLAPELMARGLWFVGLDIIGGYVTEINVTSPTCVREIMRDSDIDAFAPLLAAIQAHVSQAGA